MLFSVTQESHTLELKESLETKKKPFVIHNNRNHSNT